MSVEKPSQLRKNHEQENVKSPEFVEIFLKQLDCLPVISQIVGWWIVVMTAAAAGVVLIKNLPKILEALPQIVRSIRKKSHKKSKGLSETARHRLRR